MNKQKTILIIISWFIFNQTFSQFNQLPVNWGSNEKELDGFKYNNFYYECSPNGLKNFIANTEMDSELKSNLTKLMNSIKSKKNISDIAGIGLFATGAGIIANGVLTKKAGEQIKTSTVFNGLGVATLGIIVNIVFSPKKKHYYEFINTFNKKHNETPIIIGLKMNYVNQLNYGISLNF